MEPIEGRELARRNPARPVPVPDPRRGRRAGCFPLPHPSAAAGCHLHPPNPPERLAGVLLTAAECPPSSSSSSSRQRGPSCSVQASQTSGRPAVAILPSPPSFCPEPLPHLSSSRSGSWPWDAPMLHCGTLQLFLGSLQRRLPARRRPRSSPSPTRPRRLLSSPPSLSASSSRAKPRQPRRGQRSSTFPPSAAPAWAAARQEAARAPFPEQPGWRGRRRCGRSRAVRAEAAVGRQSPAFPSPAPAGASPTLPQSSPIPFCQAKCCFQEGSRLEAGKPPPTAGNILGIQ